MDTAEKAALLRRLHRAPPLLVLPNAWDVAERARARGAARLQGARHHERRRREVARVRGRRAGAGRGDDPCCGADRRRGQLPVTGDLERGYGDPVGTARSAWEVGLSGINFEDSTAGAMVAVDEQAKVIRRASGGGARARRQRQDRRLPAPHRRRRRGGRAGERVPGAGADCVYPILCPAGAIAELARRIDGPVNVVAMPGTPPPAELERLGVARLTFGGGLATAAYAEAARIAGEALIVNHSSVRSISRAPRLRVTYENAQRTSTSRRFSKPIR